jgi:hypothetical protein
MYQRLTRGLLCDEDRGQRRRRGEVIMHPMFVKLFIETDDDDELLAEEQAKLRATRRLQRTRPAMAVRGIPRPQSGRPGR